MNMQSQFSPPQYKVMSLAEYKQREAFEQLLNSMYNVEGWRFHSVVESEGLIIFEKK